MVDFYHIWRKDNEFGSYGAYLRWLSERWEAYCEAAARCGQQAKIAALNAPNVHDNFYNWLISDQNDEGAS